jgi:hypothetical protein
MCITSTNKFWICSTVHIQISTIIKIEDVFPGTLICHESVLSPFAFENTDPYLSRVLSLFIFGNTKVVV